MNEQLGVAIAILSSAIGGTAAAVTRYLVSSADPVTLATLRWGFGFLCVLPVALALRVRWPGRAEWPGVAALGLSFFGLFFVFYNIALGYTTAARASLALATLPLQTMIVGALFGIEPLSARKTAGVAIAMGGVLAALGSGLAAAPAGAWRGELIMTGAVRRATGRDDLWGVGIPMSGEAADTENVLGQFMIAYKADYVTPEGRLVIDEPKIREALVKAMDSYTAIYRKDCTPPDSVTWADIGNNERFLAQAVVMTPNLSLSIPNAIKSERPEDYYENTATIEWPLGPSGEPFPLITAIHFGMVFRDGANIAMAKEFVRSLAGEGWLAHYLNFSGERMLPSIPALLDQPFWLDPSDPHRMASVMQLGSDRWLTTSHKPWATGGTTRSGRSSPGRRPCTALQLRASHPSKRSTKRSCGSNRS
jgi:EamA-like transporter family